MNALRRFKQWLDEPPYRPREGDWWREASPKERKAALAFVTVAAVVWFVMSVYLVTGPDLIGGLKAISQGLSRKPYQP